MLRGFVGSEAELKRRVMYGGVGARGGPAAGGGAAGEAQLGLVATLLKDSGRSAVVQAAVAQGEAVKRGVETVVTNAQANAQAVASAVAAGTQHLNSIQVKLAKRLALPSWPAPPAAAPQTAQQPSR